MSEQKPAEDASQQPMTGRQAYNLVADTVAGPNLRPSDNLYQGLAFLMIYRAVRHARGKHD